MKITCLGDSICYGYGVQPEQAWISLLTKELAEEMPGLQIINAGVNGETAADGLGRLDGLLQASPEILYVQFGLNDAAMGEPVDVYIENTHEIIRRSQARGVRRILVGSNHPVSPEEYFPGGETYRQAAHFFNAALREEFGKAKGAVRFVDVERMCESIGDIHEQVQMLQYDGDHLSPEGNRIYCRLLAPVFRECIKEVSAA